MWLLIRKWQLFFVNHVKIPLCQSGKKCHKNVDQKVKVPKKSDFTKFSSVHCQISILSSEMKLKQVFDIWGTFCDTSDHFVFHWALSWCKGILNMLTNKAGIHRSVILQLWQVKIQCIMTCTLYCWNSFLDSNCTADNTCVIGHKFGCWARF